MAIDKKHLHKLTDYLWEIPKSFRSDMRVPARVYATEHMLEEIMQDRSLDQLVNVSTLPGIREYALVMPDAHEGYGFPIGGVAAFSKSDGIISPGGIGYDINCGVRLLRSEKTADEIGPNRAKLGEMIFKEVPSGVGKGGNLKLRAGELDGVLARGAREMIRLGYGAEKDLESIESQGMLEEADPLFVSDGAKKRGADQLGTMGAGNHFIEVGEVEKIFDEETARRLGLFANQVTVLIHTGSRGLGHQVATDYIRLMSQAASKYSISLPDRELACVPFASEEGMRYFAAMSSAANFAWANRQLITHEVRSAWRRALGSKGGPLEIVYDVAHNIAKIEGDFIVHRKGATRAFPLQPVLIPGSMGAGSYVLVGEEKSLKESFGSTCHGAGRRMSRAEAKRGMRGDDLKRMLEKKGIAISAGSMQGLAEEAPEAYKSVDEVVDVVHRAGIARKVARLKPLAVIKG